MDPLNVLAKCEVRIALPVPANPNLGEEEAVEGRGWCSWKERW